MKKFEKTCLIISSGLLVVTVVLFILSSFDYYIFIRYYDFSNNFMIPLFLFALAGFCAFGLVFWSRKSKYSVKHKNLGKVLRAVIGLIGFISMSFSFLIIIILNCFFSVVPSELHANKGYYANENYSVIIDTMDINSSVADVRVYKNVTPFLKRYIYSDIYDELAEVELKTDYVIFSYSGYDRDENPTIIYEKHYFSEWE